VSPSFLLEKIVSTRSRGSYGASDQTSTGWRVEAKGVGVVSTPYNADENGAEDVPLQDVEVVAAS